jgi:hypothetical protein
MKQYSLTCINNSSWPGCFAVFQKTGGSPGIYALVWVARPTHPGTEVTFTWSTDYSFAWSGTGVLKPGITFNASQVIPADPDKLNCVELTVDNFGASEFKPPTATGQPGLLTVQPLANVVPNRMSIGIGMSGSPVAAAQAAPGQTTLFAPRPNYWVMFGNYQTGDVIDVKEISGAVEVAYPDGITSRTATLGPDDKISVA